MAQVKPLKALRYTPKAGRLESLVCPPYDIISPQQYEQLCQANPYNLVRLELPGLSGAANPYAQAGELLQAWLAEGLLACDERPAFYLYRVGFAVQGRPYHFLALGCLVELEEFSAGVVLPHEETLSKAKEDRLRLLEATGCNLSPIYSLYLDKQANLQPLLEQQAQQPPHQEITDSEGVTHSLWVLDDPTLCAQITAAMAHEKLYIADGHHRYETALNHRRQLREQGVAAPKGDSVLMFLASLEQEGLVVFPTHRVLANLPGFSPQALLAGCETHFTITRHSLTGGDPASQMTTLLESCYAQQQTAFALYIGGEEYYQLTLRGPEGMAACCAEKSPAYRGLDVAVLHSLILEPLLGIDKQNMAGQKNLTYTRDAAQAIEQVRSGAAQCALLLNPTRVEQIAQVAAAGEKMPQKSTYFYPKLISGMVMNRL